MATEKFGCQATRLHKNGSDTTTQEACAQFVRGLTVETPELGGWEVFLTEKEKIVVLCSEQMGGWEVMTLTFNIF